MTTSEFSWIDSIGNLESVRINSNSPAIYRTEAKKKIQQHEIWLEKKYGTKKYHELQEEFISTLDLDKMLKGVDKQKTLMKMKIKYFTGDLLPKQKSYSILLPLALAAGTMKMEKEKKDNDPIKKAQYIDKLQQDTLKQLEKERKNVGKGKLFGIWKDKKAFQQNELMTHYRINQLEKYKNYLINNSGKLRIK